VTLDAYNALTTAPQPGAPLVFAFHGTGGDETQFFQLAQTLVPGAGVISPRGDVSEMGAARFFRRTGEGVYDMEDLARATAKMAGFVSAWKQIYPDRPVFAFGYSNGANILASLMFSRPDLFDRVGLLHPLIPCSPAPAAGLNNLAVLVSAGRNDPICPWPMTRSFLDWLQAQGASLKTCFHDGGHELRHEELSAISDLFNLNSAAVSQ